jgi:hypothetical protein
MYQAAAHFVSGNELVILYREDIVKCAALSEM